MPRLGIVPLRLIAGTIMVLFLRQVPVVLAFARMIPEFKSFREALFYGHFGPIGPGAIFSALLVKATLDTRGSKQLGELLPDSPFYELSSTIWPIVTFCRSLFKPCPWFERPYLDTGKAYKHTAHRIALQSKNLQRVILAESSTSAQH